MFQCFSEGKTYIIEQYQSIVNTLDSDIITIYPQQHRFSWNVTGFMIIQNEPVVIFPKNYTMPVSEEDIRKEAVILFKTLVRYQHEHDYLSEENRLYSGHDDNDSSRISSSVFLIEDYLSYGLLKRKHSIQTQTRQGRINWNRTINKTLPVISNHRPVYVNPVVTVNVYDPENLLIKIHEYVVYDCALLWGWLLEFSAEEFQTRELPCSIEEAISFLRGQLSETYVLREISLLNTLISYLCALQGKDENSKTEMLCTAYFHWVWEAICGFVLENEYNKLSGYVPSPEWHGPGLTAGISQRPDILFIKDKALYIVDAKYYNYHKNLPGWHDVVKQYYYQLTLEKSLKSSGQIEIDQIENVFIFPGEAGCGVKYIGYVDVPDVPELGCVKAFLIDAKEAMYAYAFGATGDTRQLLIDLIATI